MNIFVLQNLRWCQCFIINDYLRIQHLTQTKKDPLTVGEVAQHHFFPEFPPYDCGAASVDVVARHLQQQKKLLSVRRESWTSLPRVGAYPLHSLCRGRAASGEGCVCWLSVCAQSLSKDWSGRCEQQSDSVGG